MILKTSSISFSVLAYTESIQLSDVMSMINKVMWCSEGYIVHVLFLYIKTVMKIGTISKLGAKLYSFQRYFER